MARPVVAAPGATKEVVTTHFQIRARPNRAGPDAGALVTSAARLRWRAPELALLMADQASAAALKAGAEAVRLRAEVLAVFACNQLGRGTAAGGRALRALRAASEAGEDTTERLIRVELAACAADASAPAAGLTVLRPVLDRMSTAAPTARAAAMVTAADCVARLGGGPEVAGLLQCADQLYDTSRSVEPDAVLLRRGMVHARLAAYYRRLGDHQSAEAASRTGLAMIEELDDDDLDTGQVSGALTGELVLAMLDSGRAAEAVLASQPILRRPARPAGAMTACWLRLALVSRVHLPAGRHALAARLLGEAAADAERNHLDPVLSECRQLQAQLQETCAELADALHSIRAAHVAERRWRDSAAELRTLLAAEFGRPAPAVELRAELDDVIANFRVTELAAAMSRLRPGRSADRVGSRSRHAAPTPLPIARSAAALPAGTRGGGAPDGPSGPDAAGSTLWSDSMDTADLPEEPAPQPSGSDPAVTGRAQPAPNDVTGMPLDRPGHGISGQRREPVAPTGDASIEPTPGRPQPPPDSGRSSAGTSSGRTQDPVVPPKAAGPAPADPAEPVPGDSMSSTPDRSPKSSPAGPSRPEEDRAAGAGLASASASATAVESDPEEWRADSLIVPASLIGATVSKATTAEPAGETAGPEGGRTGDKAVAAGPLPGADAAALTTSDTATVAETTAADAATSAAGMPTEGAPRSTVGTPADGTAGSHAEANGAEAGVGRTHTGDSPAAASDGGAADTSADASSTTKRSSVRPTGPANEARIGGRPATSAGPLDARFARLTRPLDEPQARRTAPPASGTPTTSPESEPAASDESPPARVRNKASRATSEPSDTGESPAAVNGSDRSAGRHRSDVAMADLLAEALMAYQTGRQSHIEAASTPEPLTSEPPTPDEQASTAAAEPAVTAPNEPVSTAATAPDQAIVDRTPTDPFPVQAPPTPAPQPLPAPQQQPATQRKPKIRWTDLPRELVWREPGLGKPRR